MLAIEHRHPKGEAYFLRLRSCSNLIEDEQQIISFLRPSLDAENFIVDVAEDGERDPFTERIQEAPRWRSSFWISRHSTLETPARDELASQTDQEQARDGGAILIAQLIRLLLTFVGEGITLRLVQDVWPEAAFDSRVSEKERKP